MSCPYEKITNIELSLPILLCPDQWYGSPGSPADPLPLVVWTTPTVPPLSWVGYHPRHKTPNSTLITFRFWGLGTGIGWSTNQILPAQKFSGKKQLPAAQFYGSYDGCYYVIVRPSSPPPLKTFVHQTASKQWVLVLAENAHIAITYSPCFVPSPLTGIMNSEDSDATVAEEPLSGCGSDT